MFRIKLNILILLILALLVGASAVFLGSVRTSINTNMETRLKAGNESVRLANRVHEYSLVTAVEDLASRSSVVRAVQCPSTEEELRDQRREQTPQLGPDGLPVRDALGQMIDTEGRPIMGEARFACSRTAHAEMLRVLRSWSDSRRGERERYEVEFLSERGLGFASARDPDLLIASDAQGVIVARVGHDMDNWYGPTRPNMNNYPVVGRTETFGVQHDFIAWRDRDSDEARLAQVAAAPILGPEIDGQRQFLGAVLVGYLVSNTVAEDMSQLTADTDVLFYFNNDGRISFPGTSLASRERLRQHMGSGPFMVRALSEGSTGEEVDLATVITRPDVLFSTNFEGNEYVLRASTLARNEDGSARAGLVSVTSVSDPLSPVNAAFRNILLVALFLFLLGVLGVVFVFKEVMGPIEEISRGIQEVIAGNKEFMWPVEDANYLCDMSHSLNVMSARLQGKPDPDNDEAAGGGWGGAGSAAPGTGGGAAAGGAPAAGAGGISGLGGLRGRSAKKAEEGDTGTSEDA